MGKYTKVLLYLILSNVAWACQSSSGKTTEASNDKITQAQADTTIATRFPAPAGYLRQDLAAESFASYLRHLPLYPATRKVRLHTQALKANQSAQAAVIKMDVGKRDLQQCADAVMRLRAEYLWQAGAHDQIQFNFTSGFPADYLHWRDGHRIQVKGNDVNWIPTTTVNKSYETFRDYMNTVFMYAGTYSLSKELQSVEMQDVQIGDVLIQGGFPGHAVIVVDMAIHPTTKDKAFLLAQSYMPAQDIHVLKNPHGKTAWYFVSKITEQINTPEWNFKPSDLSRFSP